MRTVVLSGFMGTGKTTIGPILASRLAVPFVDTDREIERDCGQSISEIWRAAGEAAFRAREAEVVAALLADDSPKVVALGGGAVVCEATRRLALDRALVVTLTASPEVIVSRVEAPAVRPNLASADGPLARTRELLGQRAEAYAECHMTICTDGVDPEVAADAIAAVHRRDPLLVPLGGRSYPIDVCTGEPERLGEAILRLRPSSLVLVTDSNVQRARGHALDRGLRMFSGALTRVVLPPGEEHKTLATVATIWDASLGGGVDRDAVVVAAGGGVVGDLAGFAAACLLRGVRFVQAPTTLLAMVDSSVGGKTGFDHAAGKNLVGAFHQPSAVVADLEHLTTLDARQRAAGLAEIVKIAIATDAPLLDAVERDASTLAQGRLDALLPIVRAAIAAKIRVVRDDERENGRRALLNLGHTIGHAIEAHGGYARWLHGEAVALGTLIELRATSDMGWTPRGLVERVAELFRALSLPTAIRQAEIVASWPFVASDKKRVGAHVRLPVVTRAGEARVERVSLAQLRQAIDGRSDPA